MVWPKFDLRSNRVQKPSIFFWAIKGATLFVENIFVLITGNLELKCSTGDKVNAFFVVVGTFISTDRTVYY